MALRPLGWAGGDPYSVSEVPATPIGRSGMSTTQLAANPFALMMDPQAVLAAVERSERLSRLTSRICRPLDKGAAPTPDAQANEVDGSDDPSVEPLED